MSNISSVKLLDTVTVTGASVKHFLRHPKRTFQAKGTTSAGVGSATIKIQVSNEFAPGVGDTSTDWIDAGTITLTLGTAQTSDGFALDAAWKWVRANITALSGATATVSVRMGG